MSDKYSFSRPLRIKVLALFLDNLWCAKYGNVIDPGYFEQKDEEDVARAIMEYREKYHKAPTDPEDLILLAGTEHAEFVYDLYDIRYDSDLDMIKDVVIQFAREQAARIAVLEGIEDIKRGDLSALVERIHSATKVGDSILSPGIDPYRDTDLWLTDYWESKVPSGMLHVDLVLEGGLSAGELGIILAPLNRGKSMALVNIGYSAASIYGGGKNVVHFTHEMSAAQTSKRYAARTLFRFPTKQDDLDQYSDDLISAAQKLVTGNVRVIHIPSPTISDIKSHMDRLKAEGYDPELIIDDYPDLIRASHRYTDKRFELSAVFSELRDLANYYGIPCWAATQGNRESLSKEIITVKDIAEDIGKAQIADVIVSICQTYDEEKTGLCRLFMAKVRDGINHQLIGAKFYGSSQAIVTTGFVSMKSDKEAKDA